MIGSCISNKNQYFWCEQCRNIFSSERMLNRHNNLVHGKKDSAIVDMVQFLESVKTNAIKVEPPDIDEHVSFNSNSNISRCLKSDADLDESTLSFEDTVKNVPTLFETGSVIVESNDGTLTNKLINENTNANCKKGDIFVKLKPLDPQVSSAFNSAYGEYSKVCADEPTQSLVSFKETIKIEPTLIETVELVNENAEANQVENEKDGTFNMKIFESKICYLIDSNEKLMRHIQTHLDAKTHCCNICNKTFGCSSNLRRHMQIHSIELPFSCEICGENFKLYNSMKVHMKIHAPDPDYSCTVCGKSFIMNSYLKVHMKSHSDEKPHSCETCGKKFKCPYRLKRHMLVHSNERPFPCELCTKSFKMSYNLKAHLKTHSTDPQLMK